jgi:hypothetical protein
MNSIPHSDAQFFACYALPCKTGHIVGVSSFGSSTPESWYQTQPTKFSKYKLISFSFLQ